MRGKGKGTDYINVYFDLKVSLRNLRKNQFIPFRVVEFNQIEAKRSIYS